MTCNSHLLLINRLLINKDDGFMVFGIVGRVGKKVKLYGQYPPTFLKRVKSLFPSVHVGRTLHVPSGTLEKWKVLL